MKKMYISVNPTLIIQKWGGRVSTLHGPVSMMLSPIERIRDYLITRSGCKDVYTCSNFASVDTPVDFRTAGLI